MNVNLKDIKVGLSLADSELVSYFYRRDQGKLSVQIKAYNWTLIEFYFSDIIYFVDHGTLYLSNVCEGITDSELLSKALAMYYEEIPKGHSYRQIQFLDLSDEPSMEVFCAEWEAKLIPYAKT